MLKLAHLILVVAALAAVLTAAACGEGGDQSGGAQGPTATTGDERPQRLVAVADAVALVADDAGAWVLDMQGRLHRIEQNGDVSWRRKVTGGRRARDIGVLAYDGESLWVSEEGVGVRRLDGRTGRRLGRPVKAGPQASAIAYANESVWVGDAFDGRLRRIDAETLEVTSGPKLGEELRSVAVVGDEVWAVDLERSVTRRVDASSLRAVGKPIRPEGTRPFHVASAAGAVWVSDDDGVTGYRPATGERIGRYDAGVQSQPHVGGDDEGVWVIGETMGKLVRLDPETARAAGSETEVAGFRVAAGPTAIWVLGLEVVHRFPR